MFLWDIVFNYFIFIIDIQMHVLSIFTLLEHLNIIWTPFKRKFRQGFPLCLYMTLCNVLIYIQCSLVIPPPFGPEKILAVSEGGGTTREHSYAWTHELAMNLLNRKDDGYKGMLLREGSVNLNEYCFIKCIGDIDVHNRLFNGFRVFSTLKVS